MSGKTEQFQPGGKEKQELVMLYVLMVTPVLRKVKTVGSRSIKEGSDLSFSSQSRAIAVSGMHLFVHCHILEELHMEAVRMLSNLEQKTQSWQSAHMFKGQTWDYLRHVTGRKLVIWK